MLAPVSLGDELQRIAAAAAAHAGPGERLEGVLATEPSPGSRVFVCSFSDGEERSWLALDGAGEPVASRALVREAVSLAAMCELAEESSGSDGPRPRLASPGYLDGVGAPSGSLAEGLAAVEALAADVERRYKLELS
jgi:hypothetical protein